LDGEDVPAKAASGIAYLKFLTGPLPDITLCPAGGVSAKKVPDYLAFPNVACIGGSWIAAKQMINNGDWVEIEANAQYCSQAPRCRVALTPILSGTFSRAL